MGRCPACRAAVNTAASFCSSCGQVLQPAGADLPLTDALTTASHLAAAGEIDRAIVVLLPHSEGSDADPRATFALGALYLQRARYAEALPLLAHVVERFEQNAIARAYLGMAYLHTYQIADAREALDQALALAPDDFVVNLKYGEMLIRLGYFRESIPVLEHALAGTSPDGTTLEFARRLLRLAREKAPSTFTRSVNPLPSRRLRLPFRRRAAADLSLRELPADGTH